MGESSYKAMRASGMDDVIFAGSGNRPARNSRRSDAGARQFRPHGAGGAQQRRHPRSHAPDRARRGLESIASTAREVRARDVQLLFADASTGAHSPALVRQGQIGELIAAKPVQRRALLEEAAGISGLHSRRHEAELRLKGAEQNLERVDDIDCAARAAARPAEAAGAAGDALSRAVGRDPQGRGDAVPSALGACARGGEGDRGAAGQADHRSSAMRMHLEREAQKVVDAADEAMEPLRDQGSADRRRRCSG